MGGPLGLFVSAIVSPGRCFESLQEKPGRATWILLIGMVLFAVLGWINIDITMQAARVGMVESIRRNPAAAANPEQIRQIAETMDTMAPLFIIPQVIFVGISVLVIAVVVWAGASMATGKARFGHAFAVVSVASVIHPLLWSALNGLVWKLNPPQIRRTADLLEMTPSIGLDLFTIGTEIPVWLRAVLIRIDLFNIWWAVIIVMGTSILLGLKRGAGVVLAVTIWVVTTGAAVFFTWWGMS